jgi:Xaa-Pro aminopeptidase
MNSFRDNLALLRAKMREKKIQVYIIPSTDPHLGEYVPDHWQQIAWLTGFTGSSATVIITDTIAGLWTDTRYLIQAKNQLADSGFALMNEVYSEINDYVAWIASHTGVSDIIGLDGRLFSIERTRIILRSLEGKGITIDFNCDLISDIWIDRPPMPHSVAFDHPPEFCGKERSVKISEVRQQMRKMTADYHLLSSPDDIMWLLNIRGKDIKYTPLLTSFAIIDNDQILLFVDEDQIPFRLASEFDKLGIVMLPYEESAGILSTLPSDSTILVNPATTSANLFNSIPEGMKIIEDLTIPSLMKAVKNKTEIENIRKVMIRDGVVMTRFFYWLENNSQAKTLSEQKIGKKLDEMRSLDENFLSTSFSTIVAYNEHGALPHYSATAQSDLEVSDIGILLIDSGGQYLDGTTDITRTIALGTPTRQQRLDFTLVLKGAISIATVKFPAGTRGYQIDILARRALWEYGLNYGHGTGHGVGFCLNVHEGPQSIGKGVSSDSKIPIESGMLISDEPAIYREGEYGIRTENLILCFEDEETEFGKFLKFDTVTLCYIDKSMIDTSLLDKKEIDWINSYHADVYEKLKPYLSEDEKLWLEEKTSRI